MKYLSFLVLAVALCAGCGPVVAAVPRTPTAIPPTSVPTMVLTSTPVPAPTAAPTSTPTPLPPLLGASAADFARVLGPPNNHSIRDGAYLMQGHYQRCPGQNLDQYMVLFMAKDQRANVIIRQSCSAVATKAARATEALTFLPNDLAEGHPYTNKETGEEGGVWVSPTLAQLFQADEFNDCDGNPVKPGTAMVTSTPDGWGINTGACG